jgi:hypothetical protein
MLHRSNCFSQIYTVLMYKAMELKTLGLLCELRKVHSYMETEVAAVRHLFMRFTATADNTRAISQFGREIMNIQSPFFDCIKNNPDLFLWNRFIWRAVVNAVMNVRLL